MAETEAEKAGSMLRRGLDVLGIELPERTLALLIQYSLELIKWNKKVNLVAKNTSLEDVVEKHFLDSLTLLPVLAGHTPPERELLDVGSGAGFPGLVVKTASPELPVTLLEPRQRRVTFLNHMVRLLELTGIAVLQNRTEDLVGMQGSHFSVITSRAVADVRSFLAMVDGLALPGALVVCMQGASGADQWVCEKDNRQFDRVDIRHVQLPFSHAKRSILVFRKRS